MAKVVKVNDLPLVTDLTDAQVTGLDKNGINSRFPLDKIVRNNIGEFKLTDAAPVGALLGQSVKLVGNGQPGAKPTGTYANLLKSDGQPIVIPAAADGHAIFGANAYFNGTSWDVYYDDVTLPTVDMGPLQAEVDKVAKLISSDGIYPANIVGRVRDVIGTVIMQWLSDGSTQIDKLIANSATFLGTVSLDKLQVNEISIGGGVKLKATPHASLSVHDAAGTQVQLVDKEGKSYSTDSAISFPPVFIPSEIVGVILGGQSLSIAETGSTTNTIITTTPKDSSLGFLGIARPYDNGTDPNVIYASLSGLHEQANGTLMETPCSGLALSVSNLLKQENNYTLGPECRLLVSTCGEGSTSIVQWQKGHASGFYQRILDHAFYGMKRANELGLTYTMPVFNWIQGEQDYVSNMTIDQYITYLTTLRNNLNEDLKALIGQTLELHVVLYQTDSHKGYQKNYPTIALAHAKIAETNIYFHVSNPTYMFSYISDSNAHMKSSGYRNMGGFMGIPLKRIVFDRKNQTDPVRYSHFYVKEVLGQGNAITANFNVPYGSEMVLDTTLVANPNSFYGFTVVEAGGTVAIPITSVSIVRKTYVKVICNVSAYGDGKLPAGARLQYSVLPDFPTANKDIRGSGNLRDKQGDVIKFDTAGVNYPNHNWCVIFDKTINT